MRINNTLPPREILTVTELTRRIKGLLEESLPEVWIEGEISNLRIPPSGHLYFTLKDEASQIRAVLFRMQARFLRFSPVDGLEVICRGRASLYEARGDCQLILETLEPKGIGALQLAFTQLKERLDKEGLFRPEHKKPLPMLPQRIGIITSPTGAVIQDMLHILERRFENLHVLLYPVRVQGEGAWQEIASGIEYFNRTGDAEVLIIGRGGGSLEDLWPFNEEGLARAIFRSKIPVISAVGHETDYTISDLVADLRAPTPSAAAELVVKDKREIKNDLRFLGHRLENEVTRALLENRNRLQHLQKVLGTPEKTLEGLLLRIDELFGRLQRRVRWILEGHRERALHLKGGLYQRSPYQKVVYHRILALETQKRMGQSARHAIEMKRERIRGLFGKLDSLSPLAILLRGYSITRKLPGLKVLRDAKEVRVGEQIQVRLHRGELLCEVEATDLIGRPFLAGE